MSSSPPSSSSQPAVTVLLERLQNNEFKSEAELSSTLIDLKKNGDITLADVQSVLKVYQLFFSEHDATLDPNASISSASSASSASASSSSSDPPQPNPPAVPLTPVFIYEDYTPEGGGRSYKRLVRKMLPEAEAADLEAEWSTKNENGHLFILNGDLSRIVCDARACPCGRGGFNPANVKWTRDSYLALTHEQQEEVKKFKAPTDFRTGKVRTCAVNPWPSHSQPFPLNVVPYVPVTKAGDVTFGAEWYVEGAVEYLAAVAEEFVQTARAPATGRERHLVLLPVVGTRGGGGMSISGDILSKLIPALAEGAIRYKYDVGLVCLEREMFAAALNTRTTMMKDASSPCSKLFSSLDDGLRQKAAQLAEMARQGKLVVFIGAGASMAAGLPNWTGLLTQLAKKAGMSDDEIADLGSLSILDQPHVISTRLDAVQWNKPASLDSLKKPIDPCAAAAASSSAPIAAPSSPPQKQRNRSKTPPKNKQASPAASGMPLPPVADPIVQHSSPHPILKHSNASSSAPSNDSVIGDQKDKKERSRPSISIFAQSNDLSVVPPPPAAMDSPAAAPASPLSSPASSLRIIIPAKNSPSLSPIQPEPAVSSAPSVPPHPSVGSASSSSSSRSVHFWVSAEDGHQIPIEVAEAAASVAVQKQASNAYKDLEERPLPPVSRPSPWASWQDFSPMVGPDTPGINYDIDERDFPRSHLGSGLQRAVVDLIDTRNYSVVHALLASTPITEVISTNYDQCFELASRSIGKELSVLPYDWSSKSKRFILKMHGCVSNPQDIVLTREDYLTYQTRRAALAGIVQALLITKHLLFVGFSLQDDNFVSIMSTVKKLFAARDAEEKSESETPLEGSSSSDRSSLEMFMAAPNSQKRYFGTSLTLDRKPLFEELWRNDLDLVSFADTPKIDYARSGRRCQVFLDLLTALSVTSTRHLFESRFDSILTTEEIAFRDELRKFVMQMSPEARNAPVFGSFLTFLKDIGLSRAQLMDLLKHKKQNPRPKSPSKSPSTSPSK